MKRLTLFAFFAVFVLSASAQEVKFPGLDASPVDIAYYPSNAAQKNTAPDAKVVYARPSKKGRTVFGELEQYGKLWRVGANEATEITFYKPVVVGGKNIQAGTYTLYAIPNKDKWTMIINSKTVTWGAYTYDESKDVARVEVPVKTLTTPVEALSMVFTKGDKGIDLVLGWDTVSVTLPITVK
jgi:hypothetical protein